MSAENRFPLLTECLKAGDALRLFPILSTWKVEQLQALLKEIDQAEAQSAEAWKELVLQPEAFFNPNRSKQLDRGRMEAIFILAEIASVAQFYLEHRS